MALFMSLEEKNDVKCNLIVYFWWIWKRYPFELDDVYGKK
jgi:hypothetical protein